MPLRQSMRKTEFYEEEVQNLAEVDVKSYSIPPRHADPPILESGRDDDELRCRSKPQSAAKQTPPTPKSLRASLIYVLLTAALAATIGWLGYEEMVPFAYVVPAMAISVGILVMLLVWLALF